MKLPHSRWNTGNKLKGNQVDPVECRDLRCLFYFQEHYAVFFGHYQVKSEILLIVTLKFRLKLTSTAIGVPTTGVGGLK